MDDNRDYDDFKNPDLAVYNFRGYTVIRFNKKLEEIEIGQNAYLCGFTKDDLFLIASFLLDCLKFIRGYSNDVKNIEVD